MEIQQQQQTVSGHQANIGVMHGAIGQLGDNYYYSDSERQLPPPTLAWMVAYLANLPEAVDAEKANAVALADGVEPEALLRLWQQAFHAHAPGTSAPEPLEEAVGQGFAWSRSLGRIERVVILADTGMGKTPALKHLQDWQRQRSLARYRELREEGVTAEQIAEDEEFVVPVLVNLAFLGENNSLTALLADALNETLPADAAAAAGEDAEPVSARQIPAFLRTYHTLLLLDGLDFLISNRESSGLAQIRHFMELYRREQQHYVLTCRTTSYREQLGTAATLVLDDLSESQVREVLQGGYNQLNRSLQELVRNRAMLNLVLEMKGAEKEPEKTQIRISQLQNKGHLLSWQMDNQLAAAEPLADEPPLPLLERTLEQLAYAMHRDHTFHFSEQQVMELIHNHLTRWRETVQWRAVLDTLVRRGMLAADERNRWHFCRPRDQAFWAARAIHSRPERVHLLLEEANDYWWREALDILVGLIPDPTAFYFALMDRHPLAAATSIQYAGPAAAGRVTDAVIDVLVEAMGRESSYRRKQIVERLAESHHPQAPEAMFLALHQEWSSLPLQALALALAAKAQAEAEPEAFLEKAETAALRRVRDQSAPVAHIIARYTGVLRAPAGERSATKAAVREAMQEWLDDRRQPAKARGVAAIYLGQLAAGAGEAAWEPLLRTFRQANVDNPVAWCVVQALTECPRAYVEKAAVRLSTHRTYRQEKWQQRRARAVYLLGWISSPEDAEEVLEEALRDSNPLVRGFAVDALTRLNHPDARERIHALMTHRTAPESDPDVLRRMAEALGQIGTVESIPYLQTFLLHERAQTRRAIQKAIADIRQRYGLWEAPVQVNYWS